MSFFAPNQFISQFIIPLAQILYLSHDGMTDPLGQAQVLPYLCGLSKQGHRFHLVSCEKPNRMAQDGQAIRALCEAHQIDWHPLPYHQGIPVLSGIRTLREIRKKAFQLSKSHPYDWVHCRSYMAGLIGKSLSRRKGIPFLFDMRGFWADERAESGLWPQEKWLYRQLFRYFKRAEKHLLQAAKHTIVLTERAKEALTSFSHSPNPATISVIPCCADFDHFTLQTPSLKQSAKSALGLPQDTLLVSYLGSLSTWYLPEKMMALFRIIWQKNPKARLLVITQDHPLVIQEAAIELGIPPEAILLRSATRTEVPQLLMASDVGLMFIQPTFAKTASSPTKMAEYLAMGIPLIANADIGDVAQQLAAVGGGIVVENVAPLEKAVIRFQESHFEAAAIREKARPIFSLERGVVAYEQVYLTP